MAEFSLWLLSSIYLHEDNARAVSSCRQRCREDFIPLCSSGLLSTSEGGLLLLVQDHCSFFPSALSRELFSLPRLSSKISVFWKLSRIWFSRMFLTNAAVNESLS